MDLEEEVIDYLAFEENMQDIEKESEKFLRDCGKYFEG
jgi:hypothetical protein